MFRALLRNGVLALLATLLLPGAPLPQGAFAADPIALGGPGEPRHFLDGGAGSGSAIPELDALILDNMQQNHIPGVAACAFWDGNVIWSGNYGYADVERGLAVTDSTLFMLASVSKTVTGTALMQLWESGGFGLDDDIAPYLPFEVHNPLYPTAPITFRMLLTHTSSIRDDRGLFDVVTVPGDSPIALAQFLQDYLTPGGLYYDPNENYTQSEPGSSHEYSSIGVALAGYLVEIIAGQDFASYCQESVLDRLGMEDTSWFLAPLDTTRIARPYRWVSGSYLPYTHYGYPFYPAGQLRSTVSELARFLMVFTGGAEGVLEPETAQLMNTLHFPPDQGLIWFRTSADGYEAWKHTGGHYGVSTYVLVLPSARSGMVILTNGEASTTPMPLWIWNYVLSQPAAVGDGDRHAAVRLMPSVPNPFRSGTTIRFDLERDGPVTLEVYDVQGRAIATLLDEAVPAGRHSVGFDATGLADGVYLFRLRTDRRSFFQKGLLIR
ncbi:MAG: serine hydrolase [Candidatus Eisenbacteria bacterium]|uniref:Serine hydrolase n=1 Tax=Eiseniibacteriota bacterium TaxID=2212470 RepID=A0A956LYG9_UNCEI|nr:serine hydrolase [Candidatus Eisenbacteria bacterium]